MSADRTSEQANGMGKYTVTRGQKTDLLPCQSTTVFDSYWRLAAERQSIFFRRLEGLPGPWTCDPILRKYRFTNAYRASDRVSQYLIKNVIYQGERSPKEVVFRIILFKLFNRIDTWRLLEEKLESVTYRDYSFDRYDRILTAAMEKGRLFSGAYIMPSGSGDLTHRKKHRNMLELVGRMIGDDLHSRIADATSLQGVFELLRAYPMIGDFLAYQLAIDINYSELTDFSEMEFVVPGPGARDGIHKCFTALGGLNEEEVIRLVADRQEREFTRLGLEFKPLWGRRLQLVDCQNLFCEVDKYARLAHPDIPGKSKRKRMKRLHKPNPEPITYWYPPKWGLNDRVAATLKSIPDRGHCQRAEPEGELWNDVAEDTH